VRACLVPHAGTSIPELLPAPCFPAFSAKEYLLLGVPISPRGEPLAILSEGPGEHRWEDAAIDFRWPSVYVQPAGFARRPPRTARSTLWKCNCHSCRNSIQDLVCTGGARTIRFINWSRWRRNRPRSEQGKEEISWSTSSDMESLRDDATTAAKTARPSTACCSSMPKALSGMRDEQISNVRTGARRCHAHSDATPRRKESGTRALCHFWRCRGRSRRGGWLRGYDVCLTRMQKTLRRYTEGECGSYEGAVKHATSCTISETISADARSAPAASRWMPMKRKTRSREPPELRRSPSSSHPKSRNWAVRAIPPSVRWRRRHGRTRGREALRTAGVGRRIRRLNRPCIRRQIIPLWPWAS